MKRKHITMMVKVSVPADMSAAEARREVRSPITNQCNYSAESDDVKAVAVKPAKERQV